MFLIFDTETTGLPKNFNAPITDTDNWPRCIQLAWQLHDEMGNLVEHYDCLIKPEGFNIPYDAERIHGISTELALNDGLPILEVLKKFNEVLAKSKFIVGQNLGFDVKILGSEFHRLQLQNQLQEKPLLDTCTETTASLLQLPGGRGGRFKLPNLTELHSYLFGVPFGEAHNATADVEATARCFFELIRKQIFTKDELQVDTDYFKLFKDANPFEIKSYDLKHVNLKRASEELRSKNQSSSTDEIDIEKNKVVLAHASFAHLHNHTQFSVLQSTISVKELIKIAVKNKMPAVAMTDHGNMMGAFHFVNAAFNHNKEAKAEIKKAEENNELSDAQIIKPIVGVEFFVCENHLDKTNKDNGYQIVFLAKNKNGYHNLAKMSSIAYTDGFYYVPRIDKNLVEQYKEDLIVLTGNLHGEIPNKILNIGEHQAEEALVWWKNQFKDDFYIELMRHGQENEDRVNSVLINFSKKHQIKLIATNNTYYATPKDAHAHDILLCLKDNEKLTTPIGKGRGFRFGMPNQEYYFKSAEEMKALFLDVPEAILNIEELISKIELYELKRPVLLPKFDIPDEFKVAEDEADEGKRGENKYLRFLTYKGAKERYQEITPEIEERLDFELATIEKTGYPGYFLIVQDLIAEARNRDVSVGPGRGSAAGSAVAYCLKITNLDPIKYDLLFERFLNPDRVSMPDIDIDFDDEGRGRVMDYVINKYGANQVAQIITYGTMAAKSSIRDTARVLGLPLFDSDKVAKLVPMNLKLGKISSMDDKMLKEKFKSDEIENINLLKDLLRGDDLTAETLQQASVLEGSVRTTGVHACGVIITPDDITNFVPVTTAKDSNLYLTQFDNSVVESAGLLKMDFLGLKTLTLIKDTVKLVKKRHGISLDPDKFPIDDTATYELFQRGETIGIFQYESAGMQKYMKELKPTVFADLIAMNALYRPGPIEHIPEFIRRKQGLSPIKYDLDACEEYLKETYGITVYQEQVMLLSQKLAGFSKGDADVLRKAMGKKQKETLDKMKPDFITRASAKGHDPEILERIWKDWEAFASYAFNKSHSTCYAWVAYQTAYLKAHYPAEYMAAVLSNNMSDIKQVAFFMEECKQIGVKVLGPDVNESEMKFTVNQIGEVRFGLSAVKGVGEKAVESIIEEREKNGTYESVFEFAKRSNTRVVNKKAYESFAYSGALDSFGFNRSQYFYIGANDKLNGIEKLIKYANDFQNNQNSNQSSLFGGTKADLILEPSFVNNAEWGLMDKLKYEKEAIGIFLSGHPLDDYKFELDRYCNHQVKHINLIKRVATGEKDEEVLAEFELLRNKEIAIGGLVISAEQKSTKNGKPYGRFVFEDYDESCEISLFGEDFIKYKSFLTEGYFLQLRGMLGLRFNQEGAYEFKINHITLLSSLREKLTKTLTVQFPIEVLNENFINQIEEILSTNKESTDTQQCKLIFEVIDFEKQIKIDLPAKKIRVNPTNELIKDFADMNYLKIKIN